MNTSGNASPSVGAQTGHRLYVAFFTLALGSAFAWLLVGAAPSLISVFPGLHPQFHDFGGRSGWLSEMVNNAAQASHSVGSGAQTVFDYIFSGLNVVLSLLLLKLRPRDRSARLLALGMLGTAVAFNLQAHDALQVLPVAFLSQVDLWHVGVHLVSGLCYSSPCCCSPTTRCQAREELWRFCGPSGSGLWPWFSCFCR
ncbi:MAG: hypothetical protein ACT4OM_13730 [Actinomycetota bacterium]